MKVKSGVAVAVLASLIGFSSLAVASSVDQLQDLVNRDAGWAKQQLSRRGFAKRAVSHGEHAQYWWSERDQLCVRVAFEGNVASIDRVSHDECNVSGSEEGGWRQNNSWNNRYRDDENRNDDDRDDNRYDRQDDNQFRYGRHQHGFANRYDSNRYDSNRYDNHRDDDNDGISEAQMSRYCQGEAASRFHQSPRDITTDSAERSGNGYEVNGKYPQQGFDITFSCSFSHDGQFRGVRRTN